MNELEKARLRSLDRRMREAALSEDTEEHKRLLAEWRIYVRRQINIRLAGTTAVAGFFLAVIGLIYKTFL